MQQFDVCRLRSPRRGQNGQGLVVILQADLMDALDSRVVAPLVPIADIPAIAKLRPEFVIAGRKHRMVADRLSVLLRKDIGVTVASLRDRQWDIRRALDLVFVGV
jgi:toxin CcdB